MCGWKHGQTKKKGKTYSLPKRLITRLKYIISFPSNVVFHDGNLPINSHRLPFVQTYGFDEYYYPNYFGEPLTWFRTVKNENKMICCEHIDMVIQFKLFCLKTHRSKYVNAITIKFNHSLRVLH